ncbi:galectin-8-like, partial [Silurus meridionalis]
IPFTGPIPGGLQAGEMVVVQGCVLNDADRFQFDLTCGSSTKPRADIAFHFNPRFRNSPCIVCNTLQQGSWGREETLDQMPFKQGASFEAIILVQEDMFKVAVNGAHVLEYPHRIPLHRVDTFSVSGKVEIQAIGYVPNSLHHFCIFFPPPSRVYPTGAVYLKGSVLDSTLQLRATSAYFLTGSSSQHCSLIIFNPHNYCSMFLTCVSSFSVNLRCGESKNIALHLNARIKSGAMMRNSFLSESWGPEEVELSYFPFTAGKYFEIIILCQTHQFKIAVNGEHLLEYRHRVQDLSSITQLEVLGDVDL